MNLKTILPLMALLTVALLASFAPNQKACEYGCVGTSSGSATSPAQPLCPGASVTISVLVQSTNCNKVVGYPQPVLGCSSYGGCTATIIRSWSGLTPQTAMNFCVQVNTGLPWLCLYPPTMVGPTGSGSESMQYAIECSHSTWTWNISAMCGLMATVSGSCSFCPPPPPQEDE